jgi:hypothetical protein
MARRTFSRYLDRLAARQFRRCTDRGLVAARVLGDAAARLREYEAEAGTITVDEALCYLSGCPCRDEWPGSATFATDGVRYRPA